MTNTEKLIYEIQEEYNKELQRVKEIIEESTGESIRVLGLEIGTTRSYMEFFLNNSFYIGTVFKNSSYLKIYKLNDVKTGGKDNE